MTKPNDLLGRKPMMGPAMVARNPIMKCAPKIVVRSLNPSQLKTEEKLGFEVVHVPAGVRKHWSRFFEAGPYLVAYSDYTTARLVNFQHS